jgi:hypothetical protein
MLAAAPSDKPESLRLQLAGLENQLMLRRQRMRNALAGINRKVTDQLSSPAALLAAVGIGVAVEQASRRHGWSLTTVLDASNACLRLLLSFSSSVQHQSDRIPPWTHYGD